MRRATGYTGRGKNKDRPSRMMPLGTDDRPTALRKGLPFRPSGSIDSTKVAEHASIFFECHECEETSDDHIVPRQSLTVQQHLKVFPQQIETEIRKARQLDHSVPCKVDLNIATVCQLGSVSCIAQHRMIPTSDQRRVWQSDRTLLRIGKPETWEERKNAPRFTRITSRSKIRKTEIEEPAAVTVPVIDDPYNP